MPNTRIGSAPVSSSPSFSSITDSGLTAGEIVYTGTGGLLSASSALTFNGTDGLFSTVTGGNSNTPGTFVIDSSVASQPALIAKNNTNFAHAGNIFKLQMLNSSDSGDVFKLENAGTGNYITADSVWNITKAGRLTIPNITMGSSTGAVSATAGVLGAGTLTIANGGTGLSAIGSANQLLGVNKTATSLEYKTLLGTTNQVSVALDAANQITLSTPQDIATASSPTFTGLTLSGLTAGSVIFAGTSGVISQNNSGLFWNDSAMKLGVGTSTPTERLVVAGTASGTANEGSITMQRFSSSDSARFFWKDGVSTYLWSMGVRSNRTDLSFFDEAVGEFMTIQKTTGNIGIGTTNPNNRLSIVAHGAGDEPSVLMKRFQLADYARFFFESGSTFLWSMGLRGGVNDYHFTDETTGNTLIRLLTGSPNNAIVINTNGVGVGLTSPTAVLHLAAGTASASTAPLKLTTGTLMSTAEAGAKEYNGNHYLTNAFPTRYSLGGTLVDHFADAGNSTTTETDLYTDTIGLPFSVNGDKVTFQYSGIFVSSGTATRELKVYYAAVQIFDSGTLSISAGADAWDIRGVIIRETSGALRCVVSMTTSGATTSAYVNYTRLTSPFTTPTILKVTGQAAGVGAATNDIVAKLGSIYFQGAA